MMARSTPSKSKSKSNSKSRSSSKSRSKSTPRPRAAQTAVAADLDAIRIVPLHVTRPAAVAAPAAKPHLTYRKGALISAVEVFTIFWGAKWKSAPQSAMVGEINQFFDFILTSALIDELTEYNVAKYPIKHGKRSGTATITTPAPRTSVTDSAIQKMLQQQIATNKAVPKPTANSLYFVYVQPGVSVVMGGSSSCQAFCGYHNNIGSKIFYAVMPFPGCDGCTGGSAAFDALTSTSSHELCEAITDPIPGQGWYDDANGEVGDICAWQTRTIGKYSVQLEWSNRANRCI
jgi:hypothetical protein